MKALRVVAVVTAVTALVMLAMSGTGTRLEFWSYRTGLSLIRYAAYVGIAATVVSLLALLVTRARGLWLGVLVASLVAGLVTVAVPYSFSQTAKRVPPIHDITTDTAEPPLFVDVLPLRANASNRADYAGDSIAQLQLAAYPNVKPLLLSTTVSQAFSRARAAAETMGWEIVAVDSVAGRIEATATTTWFGFKDDVVVRVRSEGSGSRIDVRSVSRVGRSDVGANAARILTYLGTIAP